MKLVEIDWDRDSARLRGVDTSFSTEQIYELRQEGLSCSLVAKICDPPCVKRYDITLTEEAVRFALITLAAYDEGHLRGFAAVRFEAWNRRAVVTDFYVDRPFRGKGVGRSMMERVVGQVSLHGARHLWLETQNVNFPAIQFYCRMGFEICGCDSTLYDGAVAEEIAVYLARDLPLTKSL